MRPREEPGADVVDLEMYRMWRRAKATMEELSAPSMSHSQWVRSVLQVWRRQIVEANRKRGLDVLDSLNPADPQ